jgi:hypothetical protein
LGIGKVNCGASSQLPRNGVVEVELALGGEWSATRK